VADPSKETRVRAGIKALPQHKAHAQVASGHKRIKKKAGKLHQKGPSLSDWLAMQQNEGRRG
jgi:hypothetical protein